jgi:hypothetical protein
VTAELTDRILATVVAASGVTTNVLCKQVKVRKSVVLAELERLRQVGILRCEDGHRASKSWYLVAGQGNQFLTCSRGTPAMELAAEDAELRGTGGFG